MVKSPINNIYICDKCAEITVAVSNGEINNKASSDLRKYWRSARNMEILKRKSKLDDVVFDLTPIQIHAELDRLVVGQEHAKKVLSVAIYNHHKRLNDKSGLIKKSNILLAGPSGCGKTLLAETLAKILNVPFAIVDATSMTQAGYVGNDVEICLQRLLQMADGNLGMAQRGIIYVDEIDKIARAGSTKSNTRDISGEGVQTALLKLIEGSEVAVPLDFGKNHPQSETILFNTTNVLFICGGAFEGLLDPGTKNIIGFHTPDRSDVTDADGEANEYLTPEALKEYGLIPEIIGRLPVLCTLAVLTEDDLVRVLTQPEDAITKEYQVLLQKDGVKLIYEQDALLEIAKLAAMQKTGARGLRAIMEDVMLDIMYNLPEQKGNISKCIII